MYSVSETNIAFCLKQINSSKWGLIVTPVIFLIFNYFFILALLNTTNYIINLVAYLGLSGFTTFVTVFFAKSSLKRYRNIIKEIEIYNYQSFRLTTISNQTIFIKDDYYQLEDDTLVINRNKKFPMKILTISSMRVLFVPSWFDENEEIIKDLL